MKNHKLIIHKKINLFKSFRKNGKKNVPSPN